MHAKHLPAASGRSPTLLLAAVTATLLALATGGPAHAQGTGMLARFDAGIGSQPFRTAPNAPDTPLSNRVFGVPPGGAPWVIADLKADVRKDATIRVDGRGLLLAGTDNIGTRGGTAQVRARFFCNGQPFDSDLVTLEENGDFRIRGRLNPPPPDPCVNPRLLILSPTGSWFAAGVPER